MKQHYDVGGVVISEAAMNKEFDTPPTFDLAGQLALFNRGAQPSRGDTTMNSMAAFMKEVGSLRADEALPDPKGCVTDEYLKLIDRDTVLKAFANRSHSATRPLGRSALASPRPARPPPTVDRPLDATQARTEALPMTTADATPPLDLTQQEAIPPAGVEAALRLMASGKLHRYGETGGTPSEASLLEQAFAQETGARYRATAWR